LLLFCLWIAKTTVPSRHGGFAFDKQMQQGGRFMLCPTMFAGTFVLQNPKQPGKGVTINRPPFTV
jgi:hypothetical protein